MSKLQLPLSLGARLSVGALALLGCVGGWLVVLGGGFHSRPHRRASYTVFVDGPPAVAMALIFFCMATLAVLVLLQHAKAPLLLRLLGAGAVLVPPLVYLFSP